MRKISQLVALFVLVSFAWTQTSGKIRGFISSSDGQALAGANVMVDGTNKGAATDADGGFTILNVEAGVYSVTASYIGYKNNTQSNVVVKVDLTTPLNFSLETSAVEGEVVTIVGEKRLIEKSATNSVRTVGSDEIENSASRSVSGVLDLQAGVNITNGKLSIRGGRAEEVAYTLDGASITDVVNTGRDISAIPEALAEISVEAGGYGAHIGGANSGVVRQTLKTGGTDLGGSVRFETGDYGHSDLTATIGAPVGPVKAFFALRSRHTDDWDPTYYTDFSINDGAELESKASGVTLDGESKAIAFNSGGKNGVNHRAQDDLQINGTVTADFGPLNLRASLVNTAVTTEYNSLPIYFMFNEARLPVRETKTSLMNLRANYFLNPNMLVTVGVNTFSRNSERWDDAMGRPGSFGDVLGWADSATVAGKVDASWWGGGNTVFAAPEQAYESPPDNYTFEFFDFQRPGDIIYGWQKDERKTFGFDLGLTWQRGDHEIRAGIDMKNYSYRNHSTGVGTLINMNYALANGTYKDAAGNVLTYADIMSGSHEAALTAMKQDLRRLNTYGHIGYDDFGNEVNSGRDKAREPKVFSMYVNDKYEAGDLVVNAGLRIDNFTMDDWRMKDPDNPGWDESTNGILDEEFLDSDTKTSIQPRLGLAFPISDQTVFHLQYGKFAQMPELSLPFASTREISHTFGGQNYTPDPMGFDLDPIETTQYEVGMSHQITPTAAIDVTAFAKNTTGQIVIGKNPDLTVDNTYRVAPDAFFYLNGDFTTVNGFEFTLRTRRTNRLQTYGSYTWSDARGINSDPNTGAGNLAQDLLSPPPLMISPLYYHNKHRGAVALDYRYGTDDGLLSGLGVNFEYKFNSGHPYTLSTGGMGQRAADAGAILADARSREPLEPVGSSTTPWQTYANLKVDYNLSLGGVGVTLFAYVSNLFDTKNVINVYSRTGNAYDDGFLSDPELSQQIVSANGQTYVDLYRNINLENRQHFISDFSGLDTFSEPQIVKMGVAVNF